MLISCLFRDGEVYKQASRRLTTLAVYCASGYSDQKAYDYQFPSAVKARRARFGQDARKVRQYAPSKQKAYVTSEQL